MVQYSIQQRPALHQQHTQTHRGCSVGWSHMQSCDQGGQDQQVEVGATQRLLDLIDVLLCEACDSNRGHIGAHVSDVFRYVQAVWSLDRHHFTRSRFMGVSAVKAMYAVARFL